MSLHRLRLGYCVVLTGAVVACGSEFTASDSPDGGGGSFGSHDGAVAGSRDASTGATTGAGGSSAGTAGKASGGVGGSVGGTGTGGSGATSGKGGSSGSATGGAGGSVDAGTGGMGGSVGSTGARGAGGSGGGSAGSTADASACPNGALKCSDGTCSRALYNFESGTLDGITVRSSSGHPFTVRSFNGTLALGIDVDQLNILPEVSFDVLICSSGTIDLRNKILTFRVYFQGSPPSQFDFWAQAALPDPQSGGYLDQIGVGTGAWTSYSSPLNKSSFSGAAKTLTIQAGSLGGGFTGTIWFDDIRIL